MLGSEIKSYLAWPQGANAALGQTDQATERSHSHRRHKSGTRTTRKKRQEMIDAVKPPSKENGHHKTHATKRRRRNSKTGLRK